MITTANIRSRRTVIESKIPLEFRRLMIEQNQLIRKFLPCNKDIEIINLVEEHGGLTASQIAKFMETPEPTVYTYVMRAKCKGWLVRRFINGVYVYYSKYDF